MWRQACDGDGASTAMCLGLFATHSGTPEMLDCSSYPRQKISQEQQLKQLEALSEKQESKINTVGREGRTHVTEAKFYKTWKTLRGHVAP